ncbi:MAG: NAD(P)H-dependent oxidoreductase [Acidaminococcus sp.]|jgi:NAD(P)H-dependent FMN reductase|nr:NAD(P)H-dependent oxidoreductase [Acidaminococcus sp.]MCI2100459.1 NAD(P)H-dependent oxidoreductase [Acidaminococcus sp.]MCI2114780.1 NAD(P)H-dependent oxidoreductase [Acidaminococcus sp.]MCI2116833.1 NAD(P)H-dependent oxidoreductase [Acidaminococcus sp.]
MKKVLLIVGSLRRESFNRQTALLIKKMVENKAEVSLLSYEDLPYMNQDKEFPAPPEVARVRKEVSEADGLWFFTPEYNHSYPGILKNLLDWLSRPVQPGVRKSAVTYGKKAAISGVSGRSAASFSRAKLTDLLDFMGLELMDTQVGISLTPEEMQTNVLVLSDNTKSELQKQADAFLKFLE